MQFIIACTSCSRETIALSKNDAKIKAQEHANETGHVTEAFKDGATDLR